MRVKVKFGIGITIIMITLSSLAWMGMKESKTYYHTVAELSTLGSGELRQRIRVGGDVVTGSWTRGLRTERGKRKRSGELYRHGSIAGHIQRWRAMLNRRARDARWTLGGRTSASEVRVQV